LPAELRIANRNRERCPMISRRTIVLAFTAGIFFAGVSPVLAKSRHSNWIRMFDTDNDGTVDLAEAKKAASALFDKLDRDHDGTLDKRELARRLTPKEFAAADPDHDGTLSKDEYLAAVEQRFTAADPDHDGTLDAKELNTKAGQALLRLLK
jgi:Ca2+-binding EF-hand superfamily protein